MGRLTLAGSLLAAALSAVVSAQPRSGAELAALLERAGAMVERYFERAQSLMCLEVVRLQPLGLGLGPDGFGRTVESELRLSWDPLADDTDDPPEAHVLRQVLKVNGHTPRKDDYQNCTGPEQHTTETQPLSMLLPAQRRDYRFELAGLGRVDRRPAVLIDYRLMTDVSVEVSLVDGRDDCISFDVQGGVHGRIWLDAETNEVLRLDQALNGLVDIPLPRQAARRFNGPDRFTMERMDTTIRFKPIVFEDPDETLMLPVSSTSLRITRGSGTPRLRTVTEYSRYKRFLTGARVVPQ